MRIVVAVLALVVALAPPSMIAGAETGLPHVELEDAPLLRLSGDVDSNSPAIWDRVSGRNTLFVMTSFAGRPSTARGRSLAQLSRPAEAVVEPWPGGGVWMEAVVKDDDGAWYGYYHNENVATMCRGSDKVLPRIGAARSEDRGVTWEPLGVVLEAPPRSYDCGTNNHYFVGGVGDFSVQLGATSQDLYFFYSLYLRESTGQGVGVARLAWADRDDPRGKIMVWRNGAWLPATGFSTPGGERWTYPAATPIFATSESWHDDDPEADAFWGPSVHWNTYLGRFVMLLNRAKNENYDQEGIYVSYAPLLSDPRLWSKPVKILNGGRWYPQVLGLEDGSGTDKTAGEWARFFMQGVSRDFIRFSK